MNYSNGIEIIESGYMQKVDDLEKKLRLDPYTYKHSLNVASYLVRFLKSGKWKIDEEIAYYAGLFHDIGKKMLFILTFLHNFPMRYTLRPSGTPFPVP